MKTICVSEKTHSKLSHLGLKSETFEDIICRLIAVYEDLYFEDFSDGEATYYNERILQFENGNYEGTRKVDLDAIRRRQLR